MKIALPAAEPDACANDRWPEPARRAAAVVSLVHSGPRRVSDDAKVSPNAFGVARNPAVNVQRTENDR